jgi:DNA-binding response OmpR family regulator
MKKMMIVEDNTVIQQLFHTWYAGRPMEMLSVHSAENLAERIQSYRPDIIITDILLPGATAPYLIRIYGPLRIPIVVVSSMDTDDVTYFSRQIHAAATFHKPIHMKELTDCIDLLLFNPFNINEYAR